MGDFLLFKENRPIKKALGKPRANTLARKAAGPEEGRSIRTHVQNSTRTVIGILSRIHLSKYGAQSITEYCYEAIASALQDIPTFSLEKMSMQVFKAGWHTYLSEIDIGFWFREERLFCWFFQLEGWKYSSWNLCIDIDFWFWHRMSPFVYHLAPLLDGTVIIHKNNISQGEMLILLSK